MSSIGLTIGELAGATGVNAATLRAWEMRHGFPLPGRGEQGHRRYRPTDVDAVRAVLAERRAGATLGGAIDRVREGAASATGSVFAGLRRAHRFETHEVSRSTMVALSHALEDELSLQAERGLLVGAFQERRFYAEARARWCELARSARRTVVFADFDAARGDGARSPAEVPIPAGSPFDREWAIVHLAERCSALLVGRQLPAGHRGARRFELLWSLDPGAARDALDGAARLAGRTAPALSAMLASDVASSPRRHDVDPVFAAALTNRMVAYLDRRLGACA